MTKASKQKRLMVIVTKKPKWRYKLFCRRFSKGWDVIVNPTLGLLGPILGAYEHTTRVYDDSTVNNIPSTGMYFDKVVLLDGNPLKMRTYQELWANLTYDEFKELGHEDGQGFIA